MESGRVVVFWMNVMIGDSFSFASKFIPFCLQEEFNRAIVHPGDYEWSPKSGASFWNERPSRTTPPASGRYLRGARVQYFLRTWSVRGCWDCTIALNRRAYLRNFCKWPQAITHPFFGFPSASTRTIFVSLVWAFFYEDGHRW